MDRSSRPLLGGLLAMVLIASACSPAGPVAAPTQAPEQPRTRTADAPAATTVPRAVPAASPAASPPNAQEAAKPAVAARQAQQGAAQVLVAPTPTGKPGCCSTGGTEVPNGKPYDSTFFESPGTNPFIDTLDDHLSTFGMDVDTASYAIMRRFIADGNLPEPASVRVEEYINAFDYRYEQPSEGEDFLIAVEGGPSPYNPRNEIVQVGIQGRRVDAEERKPASLTFVVDTSGSMNIESRLNTVKRALKLLVGQMRAGDRIALVTFGSTSNIVLQSTDGANKAQIEAAVDRLVIGGSTNLEAGLADGFRIAQQAYRDDAINMVILCTDGVANNGVSDAEGLLKKYQQFLQRGIQLWAFGFGMGNYNDVMLEKLGDKGNGSYAYIDSLDEARRVFVQNLTGTLQTIGRDAKIQVDFNPDEVSRYRLLGYENRDVADNDFRNDKVDGGEVGAGRSVTALYEITRKPDAQGRIATVTIRYQTPDKSRALEQSRAVEPSVIRKDVRETSRRFQLATTVAQFGEVLKKSFWAQGITLQDVGRTAADRISEDDAADVRELRELIQKAASLPAR